MTEDDDEYGRICLCGSTIPAGRVALGYWTCLPCGETRARGYRHTIVCLAKSNYVVVTDQSLLKGLNKYANS